MDLPIAFGSFLLPLIVLAGTASGVELRVERDQFTIDGKPAFLLGCSYYGGLGASEKTIHADLDELHRLGFSWIRVWADWTAFGTDHLRPTRLRAARAGSWAGRPACQFCHAFCAFSRTCAR